MDTSQIKYGNELMIRPAARNEVGIVAQCIAEGFEQDFSFFCKDMNIVREAPKISHKGFHRAMFFIRFQDKYRVYRADMSYRRR